MSAEQSSSSEKIENHFSIFGIAALSSELLIFFSLLLELPLFLFFSYWPGTRYIIFCATPLLILSGLLLGAIGLFQKNHKKTLVIIALVLGILNGIGLCLIIVAWIIYVASAA